MSTLDATDLVTTQTAPPADYAIALENIAPNITGLVDENRTTGETWYEALIRLLPAVVATDQQRKLLEVQTQRAQQGLPPLDTSQYGLGVRVGLSADSKQLLIYGGVALFVLAAFGVLRFGSRR